MQQAVNAYNALVRGVHNYYQMATDITTDCQQIHHATFRAMYNRLHPKLGQLKPNSGDWKRYKDCKRIFKYQDMTILPIAYCRHRKTVGKKKSTNLYTPEGREFRHKELSFPNAHLLQELAKNPVRGQSIEYNDNRVSLFSGQQGKCSVTGYEFLDLSEIHCHHRHPRSQGGGDNYMNLTLVLIDVHRLIHAKKESTIRRYMEMLKLDEKQLSKLNQLRKEAGLDQIKAG